MAFQRIHDFEAVHHGQEDTKEAFAILRESLGIDTDLMGILAKEESELFGDKMEEILVGSLFGLMVGLIAADYASEI